MIPVFLWLQSLMESLLPSTLSFLSLPLSTLSLWSLLRLLLRLLRPLLLMWLLPLVTGGRERLILPSLLEDPGSSLPPLLSSITLLLFTTLWDTLGSDTMDSDTDTDWDMEVSDTDTDSVWDTMEFTED